MTAFGNYEIIQELYRGPVGAVVRARLPGQPGEVAIKIFDPSMMGLLEADAATQSFLDRAALQKLLAERGAKHWAPVHELRPTDEGAYYVSDYYPLTIQRLAADQVPVDGKSLHALVAGVVKGLLELQLRHRRAHGDLKSTNVLLAGAADDLVNAQVLLGDPATEADSPDDWARDLLALGDLIHQLVLHRPFRPTVGRDEPVWPVSPSPEWGALGRQGERWRELCNRLLAPNAAERPANLEAVVEVLREMIPPPR